MFDAKKIDQYFELPLENKNRNIQPINRRTKRLQRAKLLLPAIAALLTGLLIIIPYIKKNINDITADLITPQKGELEKFHMEKGNFYITDFKNIVNNVHAEVLDETEAGSKIIKMTNPEGIFPSASGKETTIKAPIGFYNQNTKILNLQNKVTLIYDKGTITNTAETFFDFNTNKAYGVKPVKTKSETIDISSQGFEYYKDKNLLIYTGKTHIILQDNNNEGGF
ncbi:MAG: LPS export ABC transporter periplasmic protein LptC [Alphaproteobacteria bacterium]|nr:LPS export ABC transporter periplasmic protein LptC [Alphaproteobacteria bacterium]